MLYQFPYKYLDPVEVPEKNLIGIFECQERIEGEYRSEEEILLSALKNPIGSEPLRSLINPGDKVLFIVDDNTRATPAAKIVPLLLREVEKAKVKKKDVRFIIASGTHRMMSLEEKVAKLGDNIVSNYDVLDHQWFKKENLYFAGKTPLGVEVWPNKVLKEADFIAGIGQIFPHAVAGFSGGGKIIVPGVCGEKTCGPMHWGMVKFRPEDLFGVLDNPVRKTINQVALKAGLKYIFNVVIAGSGRIVGAVSGHPVKAHEAGVKTSRKVHAVSIPERADIVIVDSFGTDIDYWQAIKAITPAGIAMKDDGVVIHVCECSEGVSRSHPEVLKYGYLPEKDILRLVEEGKINKTVAVHMIQASRVITDKGQGILVSPGISKKDAEKLGFTYAADPQEAIDLALKIKGADATICILRKAGDLLPVIKNQ